MSKRRTKYVEPRARVKVEDDTDKFGFRVKRERSKSPIRWAGGSDRRSIEEVKRERSISPFTLTFDRWTNFKTAEKKLEHYAQDALVKYDRTPEDHPKYAEEWKIFWERRYSEIKASGQDPDSHDFITEWIPAWSSRCAALMAEEVATRRAALLKKFRLESDKIPIRSDFKKEKVKETGKSHNRYQQNHPPPANPNQPADAEISIIGEEQGSGGSGGRESEPSIMSVITGNKTIDALMSGQLTKTAAFNQPPPSLVGNDHKPAQASRDRVAEALAGPGSILPVPRFASKTDPREITAKNENNVAPGVLAQNESRMVPGFPPASETGFKRGTKSKLVVCLRLLSAFSEYITDDLNFQLSSIRAKAQSLEKSFEGASKVLIEDKDIQQIFHQTRIQLKSCEDEIDESMFGSFQNCLQNLDRILEVSIALQQGDPYQENSNKRQSQEVNLKSSHSGREASIGSLNKSQEQLQGAPAARSSQEHSAASKPDMTLAYAEQIAAQNELLYGKKLKPDQLVFAKNADSKTDQAEDNLSTISSVSGSVKQSATVEAEKQKSQGLKNYRDCQKFLCESIAVVLLQTGNKSFTKHGLQNLIVELMKKLELSESDSKLGSLAKHYNTNYESNKKLDISLLPPNMDSLHFTTDELSCLLQNYVNLSHEERRCFDYYMLHLKLRGAGRNSAAENELLEVYAAKSKDKSPFTSLLHQDGDNDMVFKPVSFDYKNKFPRSFGRELANTSADGRKAQLSPFRENFREIDRRERERERERERDRIRAREREREREKEREREEERNKQTRRRKRRKDDKSSGQHSSPSDRNKTSDNTHNKSDKKRKEEAKSDHKQDHPVVDLDDPDLEIQHEPVQSNPEANKNLDGSVNLSHKYKDPQLNQWVRKNEIDKPMFQESSGPEGELIFKCTVCDSQLYGVKNVQTHYNGKKHKKKLEDDKWSVFDPTVWEPRTAESEEAAPSGSQAEKGPDSSQPGAVELSGGVQ